MSVRELVDTTIRALADPNAALLGCSHVMDGSATKHLICLHHPFGILCQECGRSHQLSHDVKRPCDRCGAEGASAATAVEVAVKDRPVQRGPAIAILTTPVILFGVVLCESCVAQR